MKNKEPLAIIATVVVTALLASGWWVYGHYLSYPQEFKTRQLIACVEDGTPYDTCACFLGVAQAHYRYSAVKVMDAMGESPQALKDAVQIRCLQAQ